MRMQYHDAFIVHVHIIMRIRNAVKGDTSLGSLQQMPEGPGGRLQLCLRTKQNMCEGAVDVDVAVVNVHTCLPCTPCMPNYLRCCLLALHCLWREHGLFGQGRSSSSTSGPTLLSVALYSSCRCGVEVNSLSLSLASYPGRIVSQQKALFLI